MYDRALSALQHVDPRLILTVGAGLLAAVWMVRSSRQRYNLPPYPWTCFPLVGNMMQLFRLKKRAYEVFADLSKTKEYNKMFMMRIGAIDILILNEVTVAREALLNKGSDFAGRPDLYSASILLQGRKDILFIQYGSELKYMRKLTHTSLRNYAAGRNLETHAQISMERFFEDLDDKIKSKQPFDIRPYIVYLVFNLMSGIIYNKQKSFQDPEFQQFTTLTQRFLEVMGTGLAADFFPWLRGIPTPSIGKMKSMMKEFEVYLDKEVKEHRKNFNPSEIMDVMDFMMTSQMELEKEDPNMAGLLTDTTLMMLVFDMIGASIDTVVTSLHYLFAHMAQNPQIQTKMQDEIDKVLKGVDVSVEDRSLLPYTEACMTENARKGLLAVFGVPLATTTDTKLDGYDIPKDTMVMVNLWSIHNDPEHWNQPEVFRPERFLDEQGQIGPRPPSYMPFGVGRRGCVGEGLAKSMLMLLIPTLFQKVSFSAPAGKELDIELVDNGFAAMPKPYDIVMSYRK